MPFVTYLCPNYITGVEVKGFASVKKTKLFAMYCEKVSFAKIPERQGLAENSATILKNYRFGLLLCHSVDCS